MADGKRFLLIRLSSFGDILLTTPILRLLKASHPGSSVHFLTGSRFADALRHHPGIDRLLLYPRRKDPGKSESAATRKTVRNALRENVYDAVIDLHNVTDSALLAVRARGRMKIGHREQLLERLFSCRCGYPLRNNLLKEYAPLAAARCLAETALLSLPEDPEAFRPEFYPGAAAEEAAALFLGNTPYPDRPPLLFNTGASRASKQWPVDHWIRTGRRLLKETGRSIVLIGGPEERETAARIRAALGEDVADATGLPILTAFALLRRAALCLTPDSAALHAASAFAVPTVALFGPSNPRKFGPPFPECRILTALAPCAPCSERRTRRCRKGCLAGISPREAADAALSLLDRPGGDGGC